MEATGGRGGPRGGSRSSSGRGRGGGPRGGEDRAQGKQSYRKVEVASGGQNGGAKADSPAEDPAPAPFQSSLRASMQTQPPAAPAKTERKVVVERRGSVQSNVSKGLRDRSQDERGGSRRTASPARSVKAADGAGAEHHERRVISLSSPDRDPQTAGAKHFVSSLASSLKDNSKREKDSSKRESPKRQKDRGSSKSFTSSRKEPAASRRSSSRDSRDGSYASSNRGHSPQASHRRIVREGDDRAMPLTRPTLSRKNSTDSISSQRSDRSERNPRWDRRRPDSRSSSRRSSPSNDRNRPKTSDQHERPGISSSLRDRNTAGPGLRRLSSGSLGTGSTASTRLQSTKSNQDVRFQGRTDATRNARQGDDSLPRRTSLDGSTIGLRRTTSLGARSISNDVRVDGRTGASNARSVAVDPQSSGPRVEKPSDGTERMPLRSSLTESIKHDKELTHADAANEHSEASEVDRKKLADQLRERMEARKLGRGKSLAELMGRSASSDDHQQKESRGPVKSNENQREAPSEKEARTAEFFSRLDRENAKREQAGRVIGFQSSLKAAVNAPTRLGMGSSLRASIAPQPRPATNSLVEKIKYSISELRRLMAFALPRPADLPDMKITEVFQVRDPASVPSRRRGGRGGSGGPQGRSIGSSISRRNQDARGSRQAQRGQGGAGSRGRDRRGGGGGRGRNQPPPPPLYDGPVEPLTVSENRWVPKKAQEGPVSVLSQVKSLLNKLTREKFKKLTEELCSIEITTLSVLRSIVSCIMDKALEEPNFADVYADLCKEFVVRTKSKRWKFLHSMADTQNSEAYRWIALNGDRLESYAGPFTSVQECLDAATSDTEASSSCNYAALSSETFHYHDGVVVIVGEKEKGSFYYAKINTAELQREDEPIGGPFETADKARQEALQATSFTQILVTRCQNEFEKTSNHTEPEPTDENLDERQRNILALRAKRKMLGNMRFLGELFKVGILKQHVIQDCIFQLLGLELIPGEEVHAQTCRFPDEEDLEALCKMLGTVGKKFDRADTKTIMKIIILRLVELSEDKKLNSRSRFLIQDVLEMRDHMWEPRRKELQQKTLDEVRREAQKLQQQGKNAQHDNLTQRRRKTQISSAQLARESSNLIVARAETEPIESDHEEDDKEEEEEDEEVDEVPSQSMDPVQMRNRIKSIIQEYISIVDMEEASACVRELPVDPFHAEFAEEVISVAVDGKENERELAVDLLAGLYRTGALSADAIQQAIVSVTEFLEDMRIDIPLIHQYSALLFGRLIASGCFGLSWMVNDALRHLIDSKLTSMIFPEVLSVVESETNEQTVVRMLNDEELSAASLLPRSMRSEAQVEEYLRANGIEDFFNGGRGSDDEDDDDELDPEIAGKMRSTIDEYISVMDLDEVVRCIEELEGVPDRWMHFAHTLVMFSIEAKVDVRVKAGELLAKLAERKHLSADDAETAMEFVLEDFEDLLIDIPQLGDNLGDLLAPLFQAERLSLSWLREAASSLVAEGHAAKLLSAVLSAMERLSSRDAVVAWWGKQDAAQQQGVWQDLASSNSGSSSLDAWRQALQQ